MFDKDGTLGDCTPALHLWCRGMTECIQQECLARDVSSNWTNRIVSNFHRSIGWDADRNDVVPSAPLSAATWSEIVDISASSLFDSGLQVKHHEVLEWHQKLGDIHTNDLPLIKNLPEFLQHFKNQGIMVSICTSDDRSSTNACMRNWEISDIVDFSICGDEVQESKPSPQPLMELCSLAGVLPKECLVIGDTSSDTMMGAKTGSLVVGVLTGSGTSSQLLDTGAHIVLPNIGYLKDLLLLSTPSSPVKDISIDDESSRLSPIKVKAA